SVAAMLAETLRVVVLERESHPGLHSTGRSAALFSEIYGGETIRALSRGSREFLHSPPPGFATPPLVRQRARLLINAEVNTLEHTGAAWKLVTADSTFHADVVINAAGAWADVLAR